MPLKKIPWKFQKYPLNLLVFTNGTNNFFLKKKHIIKPHVKIWYKKKWYKSLKFKCDGINYKL